MITGEQLINVVERHMDDVVARGIHVPQVLEEFGIDGEALLALIRYQQGPIAVIAADSKSVLEAMATAYATGFCHALAVRASEVAA